MRGCSDICVIGPYFPREGCHADQDKIVEELLEGADPKKVFSSDRLLDEIKKGTLGANFHMREKYGSLKTECI